MMMSLSLSLSLFIDIALSLSLSVSTTEVKECCADVSLRLWRKGRNMVVWRARICVYSTEIRLERNRLEETWAVKSFVKYKTSVTLCKMCWKYECKAWTGGNSWSKVELKWYSWGETLHCYTYNKHGVSLDKTEEVLQIHFFAFKFVIQTSKQC